MSDASLVKISENSFNVKGELTFTTVRKLKDLSEGLFKNISEIKINFNDVVNADSAGLALLIEWQRYANKNKKNIQFENLPEQLINLAKISNLTDVLIRIN